MWCFAKDRNNNECRNHAIKDGRFCKLHDYMSEYTDEMIENSIICSGCKKMHYNTNNTKTCEKCKIRSETVRADFKENIIFCKKDGCKFKRSDERGYCQKHFICLLLEEVGSRNKRLCKNYVRGCREELELDHIRSACETCLSKYRESDNNRRHSVSMKCEQQTYERAIITEKQCTTCCKSLPLSMFDGVRGITKTCENCRDENKKNDEKRDKDRRNEIARINDATPARIEVKAQWKENNYSKVAEYGMNTRQHRIERDGIDEYQRHNAENAKNWRDNNPEKVLENKKNNLQNLNIQYKVYIRSASDKNLEFKITFEQYEGLVCGKCHYCGIIADKGFNGIDRKDQTKGYILENCVNCCQMCNYMKKSLSDDIFIKRIEHILTNKNIIDGNLYPEIFANHTNISYYGYQKRALKKKIYFYLSKFQFLEITSHNCYICGKENTEIHKNGIDRFDNEEGYFMNNCRCCCGECNYLKREYTYDELMSKLIMINSNYVITDYPVNSYDLLDNKKELTTQLEVPNFIDNLNNIPLENVFIPSENTIENTFIPSENTIENTFIPYVNTIEDTIIETGELKSIKNKRSIEDIREYDRIRKREQRQHASLLNLSGAGILPVVCCCFYKL
jgi:hypothetical protein